MNGRDSQEREIREIAIAANSGEATDAQIARLDELVRGEAALANYAARVFDQQASLAWQGMMRDERLVAPECGANLTESINAGRGAVVERSTEKSPRASTIWSIPTIAVGIAFLLGALAVPMLRQAIWADAASPLASAVQAPPDQPTYEARLVRSTACFWDGNSAGSREIGSWLTSGESLHLLEGLAEFKLNWSVGGNATLSLEGPAAMMLTSEGMPTLRFGRLTAAINTSHRPFVLETPVGRLVVTEYGSIGVSAYGNDAEIHVFDGAAMLESAWLSPGQQEVPVRIEAGQAIRIEEGKNGELSITEHSADEQYFAAQVSMDSDALVIPASYVDAMKAAAPIAYWRFERDGWPRVPNEMGDGFECQVKGSLGTTTHQGNQAVEFGVTDQGGEIISSDVIDDSISDSYSIEFWIKPSHYHVGAVISLVGDSELPAGATPHGLLCELGGTGKIPTAVHHPGRVRFLHRNPPSNDTELGTSCYSTVAYTLRKWQHVVVAKDGPRMRLYINGALAGEAEDPSELAPGLRLLVGRLYPSRGVRPFIGQLDELALYDRALSPDEIVSHYHLVRPQIAHGPSS